MLLPLASEVLGHNQSDKAQLYPNVKVSVYGANDFLEVIATPTDYLLSKQHYLAITVSKIVIYHTCCQCTNS